MCTVGWLDSTAFDAHRNAPNHPERPERLEAIREGLARSGLDSRIHRQRPSPVDRALLESVHKPTHVNHVQRLCAAGGGRLDADTSVVEASWHASMLAAGAVVEATQQVLGGRWRRAFCSVRPPGHHATSERAMGFCLFSNVALGAEAAIRSGQVKRVAIIDWDVHHGNGTQDIFWERGDVLYASWHQYPWYPGSGAASETGAGAGKGLTVNCPMPSGAGDAEVLSAWEQQVRPALDQFEPELLLISAGFDADERDPLAGLRLTASGFAKLSQAVVRWSDAQLQGRVVSVLEGGYSLEALAEDVPLHIESLL